MPNPKPPAPGPHRGNGSFFTTSNPKPPKPHRSSGSSEIKGGCLSVVVAGVVVLATAAEAIRQAVS